MSKPASAPASTALVRRCEALGITAFTDAQISLIRSTVAIGCTDEELLQLLVLAARYQLDPLARQICMIKRWQKALGREVATPQTTIDGYRLIADRTGCYSPGRTTTYDYTTDGQLLSATAYVIKLVAGTWHEVSATAFWAEYAQTTKDGTLTSMWAKMNHLMLGKCAEALALRRAFPAQLSGLYTNDELGSEMADSSVTIVDVTPDSVVEGSPVLVSPAPEPAPMALPAAPGSVSAVEPGEDVRSRAAKAARTRSASLSGTPASDKQRSFIVSLIEQAADAAQVCEVGRAFGIDDLAAVRDIAHLSTVLKEQASLLIDRLQALPKKAKAA